MPVTVKWHIPNHVIYTCYTGKITLETAQSGNHQTLELLRATPDGTIHNLVDLSEQTGVALALRDIRDIISVFGEPNYGWTVVIGQRDHVTQFMLTATRQLFQMKLKYAASLNEAFQFLKTQDPTLY